MKKKLLAPLLGFGIISACIGTNAYAQSLDTLDHDYNFKFPTGYHMERETGALYKSNDSSVYQNNYSISGGKVMYAWIINSETGKDLSTKGEPYTTITSGEHKNIPNLAYERGAHLIKMKANTNGYNSSVIYSNGVWSSDSR
ncbi:DUF2712 domain-containing protein [Bacillus pseudomycoides]|uniref:DUF2712 domain-containing protein n=1 Tax=Bacillus pseudomycoides TaxID=64104 RepID=UPI000BED3017|nr:DUF2712 domain-containing protein [Bacillus pseudomycoides]PDY44066.1 hypothetical protein CON79_27675 [Bacillus pseudomycoides]PHB31890.1 hypothetical protein COE83_29360 [Bacillus pseudomycoides]